MGSGCIAGALLFMGLNSVLNGQGAFLRMIDIDPESGVLVTSYANIVEFVKGPRMALIVDPGDGAYADAMGGAR